MRNPEQVAFYHTAAWKKCRESYAASVGGLCERCSAKGIIRAGSIVHHRNWITAQNINDPEILLSFENLELLCLDCHNEEHYGSAGDRRYYVDRDGQVKIKTGGP